MNDFEIIPAQQREQMPELFGKQKDNFFIAPSKTTTAKYDLSKIQKMLHQMCQSNMLQQKIAFPTDHGLDFIQVKKIIRCEGYKKYTIIFTTDTEPILSSYNIGKFAKLFQEITVFFLTHKSHLVNINYIKNYRKSGLIQMVDNTTVPVSVRRRNSFFEVINQF